MQIILSCFILVSTVFDQYQSMFYVKNNPVKSYSDLQRYLLTSKLLEMFNKEPVRPLKSVRHVKMVCTDASTDQVLCNHNYIQYRIKLKNGTDHNRKEIENIIRSVYENVELRNGGLLDESGTDGVRFNHRRSPFRRKERRLAADAQAIRSTKASVKAPESYVCDQASSTCPPFITLFSYASSPLVIVLPPETTYKPGYRVQQTITTPFPYVPCIECQPQSEIWRPIDPSKYIVIECDPNEFGPVMPCCYSNMSLAQNAPYLLLQEKSKPQVYSCRWQGKRDTRPRTVVFLVTPRRGNLDLHNDTICTKEPKDIPADTLFHVQYYSPKDEKHPYAKKSLLNHADLGL